MKKYTFAFMLIFCSAFVFAKTKQSEKAPNWLTNTEKAYPVAKYIRAVGEGSSSRQAQNDALSAVSLYFDTKTEILSVAVKEAQSVLSGDAETFSQSQGFSQMVNVSSNADFFCVQFTDPYYDKKRDTFYVLAYIDKANVASIYSSRIAFLLESIGSYRSLAHGEGELFRAAGYLHKANVLASLAAQYIQSLVVVVPEDAPKYKDALSSLARIPEELARLKKNMSFSIRISPEEQRYDPIFATISNILEEQGFVYAAREAQYALFAAVSCIEETYDVGDFVRASVVLTVTDAGGNAVYSYSKTYPRISGTTLEHTYTRAIHKVQTDLEEHLFSEYR